MEENETLEKVKKLKKNGAQENLSPEKKSLQGPDEKIEFITEDIEEEASETQETSEELLEGGLSSLKSTDPTIMGQGKKLLENLSGKVAALKEKYQRNIQRLYSSSVPRVENSLLNETQSTETPFSKDFQEMSEYLVSLKKDYQENIQTYENYIAKLEAYKDVITTPKEQRDAVVKKFQESYPDPIYEQMTKEYPTVEVLDEEITGMNEGMLSWKEVLRRVPNSNDLDMADYLSVRKEYDSIQKKMYEQISSPSYQEKLALELKNSGLFGMQTAMTEKRKNNLSKPYIIVKGTETIPGEALGHYMPDEKKVYLPSENYTDKNSIETTGGHEFQHEITEGNDLMTPYAKNLYTNSIKNQFNLSPVELKEKTATFSKEDWNLYKELGIYEEDGEQNLIKKLEYFKDPTEIDARKKTFERELEQMSIWKYGETFTMQHLEEALKKFNSFSWGSQCFLTLMNKEAIPTIMNSIAAIETPTEKQNPLEKTRA